ncbi:hypothetical protein [Candidatus Hamiltonella defensa]|nr:hypothetical protein [Candidatus Hamiltonella defensa]ATW22573.1 hypothetical protein BJP44_05695 [Candidatus Hamiltonella defensa]
MSTTKLTTRTDLKYIDGIEDIKENVISAAEMTIKVTNKRRQNILNILEQLKNISAELQNKLTFEDFDKEKITLNDSLIKIREEFTQLNTNESNRTGEIIKSSIATLEKRLDSSSLEIKKDCKKIDETLNNRIKTLTTRLEIRITDNESKIDINTHEINSNKEGIKSNKELNNNINKINTNKKGIESNTKLITNNANQIEDIKNISLKKINENVDDNLKNTQTSLNTALENYKNLQERFQLLEKNVSKNTQTTTWVLNVVNPVLNVWNRTLEYVSNNLKYMKLTPLEQETLDSTASVNRSTTSTDTYSLVSASSGFPQSEEISYSANIQQEKSFSSYTMAVNNVPVSAVSN